MSELATDTGFCPDSAQNGADSPTHVASISRFRKASNRSAESRYRPITLHARGGVGEVFRAEDAELDREVALKQLQPDGANDPEFRARFVREARITGRLQHPGIVPVYGLVHDADGQPSYAMRFVDGESLAAAIKRCYGPGTSSEPPLTLRQLLTRFVAVCNAVAYAHSKGVVHRDLKPANVMLGPFGETYVVDWGLAKELGNDTDTSINGPLCTPESIDATQHGEVIGTPSYMAPEQAEGRWSDVGPAADVYSLGATLYSILTGHSPFTGSISDGVLDDVRAGRFGRPSQVRAGVSPSLEAICLKAMALAPKDRYASALDLAADVERWLADEPVQVYAESWPARWARWARRHRALVGSSAAAAFVALVSLTIATFLLSAANGREQAARQTAQIDRDDAARQRDRANEHFRLARDSVGAILTSPGLKLLRSIPQAEAARRQLLETALNFHEEFLRRAAGDPTVREDAAIARFQTADLEAELGRKDEAIRQYEQAAAMLRAIDNTHPWHDHVNLALERLYNNLSIAQSDLGRLDAAEESLKQCVTLTEALVRDHPNDPTPLFDLAKSHHNIGRLQYSRGQLGAAEKSYKLAVKVGGDLLAKNPTKLEFRIDQSKHLRGWADILRDTKRFAEAEAAYREALDLVSDAAKDSLPDLDQRRVLAGAQLDLARLLAAIGKRAEAEQLLRSCVAEVRKFVKDFPNVASHHQELGQALGDLGELMNAAGRTAEARAAYQECVETQERAIAIEPASIRIAIPAGGRMCNYGVLLDAWKDPDAAIKWYDKAAKLLEEARRRAPTNAAVKQYLGNTYWNRAMNLAKTGHDHDAVSSWRRASEFFDGPDACEAFVESAHANVRLNDMPAAAQDIESALALRPDAATRFKLAFALAHAAATVTDFEQADAYAARATGILIAMRADPVLSRPETLKTMTTHADFAPLRKRADFRNLLAELTTVSAKKPQFDGR